MKNILIFSLLTTFLLSSCIMVYDKTKVKRTVSVYARQELAMSNSGVGSVSYSGDAVINTMNSSGVVKIKKPS